MISHRSRAHNAARRGAAACAAAIILCALGACGEREAERAPAPGAGASAGPCPVTCDASGWRAFTALGARITSGASVTQEELTALGNEPAFTRWRESLGGFVPPALRIGNWVEEAFSAELGDRGPSRQSADKREYGRSYRWSWDRRAEVDSLVALFEGGLCCDLLAEASPWIPAARRPDSLSVVILPTKPELRWHEGAVFVDTGVLVAGMSDQLKRQIVGLVYRNLGATAGPNPIEVEGASAVAQAWRVLRNEGVAAWIEQLPRTYFRADHYRLAKVVPVPEQFYQATIDVVELCNRELPALFADPALMAARGRELMRTIAAGGFFSEAGYGMAAAIVGRLGEARLQAAAPDVATFLAAYQEAALQNGDDRPAPGAPGRENYESVPAFSADVHEALQALLAREFAAGS